MKPNRANNPIMAGWRKRKNAAIGRKYLVKLVMRFLLGLRESRAVVPWLVVAI